MQNITIKIDFSISPISMERIDVHELINLESLFKANIFKNEYYKIKFNKLNSKISFEDDSRILLSLTCGYINSLIENLHNDTKYQRICINIITYFNDLIDIDFNINKITHIKKYKIQFDKN